MMSSWATARIAQWDGTAVAAAKARGGAIICGILLSTLVLLLGRASPERCVAPSGACMSFQPVHAFWFKIQIDESESGGRPGVLARWHTGDSIAE